MRESINLHGKVEIFVTKGKLPVVDKKTGDIDFSNCNLIHTEQLKNIILGKGKDAVINSLTSGFVKTIARMAIGDRGAIPSDPTVPKVPVATMVNLYNEIFRSDIDVIQKNIGTPGVHEVKFIKTFSALDIPITSFSNQAKPVVNEVGLVMCDLLSGTPLPRLDIASPGANLADEELFSIRCFKSVPFDAANEMAITIRYTVYFEG